MAEKERGPRIRGRQYDWDGQDQWENERVRNAFAGIANAVEYMETPAKLVYDAVKEHAENKANKANEEKETAIGGGDLGLPTGFPKVSPNKVPPGGLSRPGRTGRPGGMGRPGRPGGRGRPSRQGRPGGRGRPSPYRGPGRISCRDSDEEAADDATAQQIEGRAPQGRHHRRPPPGRGRFPPSRGSDMPSDWVYDETTGATSFPLPGHRPADFPSGDGFPELPHGQRFPPPETLAGYDGKEDGTFDRGFGAPREQPPNHPGYKFPWEETPWDDGVIGAFDPELLRHGPRRAVAARGRITDFDDFDEPPSSSSSSPPPPVDMAGAGGPPSVKNPYPAPVPHPDFPNAPAGFPAIDLTQPSYQGDDRPDQRPEAADQRPSGRVGCHSRDDADCQEDDGQRNEECTKGIPHLPVMPMKTYDGLARLSAADGGEAAASPADEDTSEPRYLKVPLDWSPRKVFREHWPEPVKKMLEIMKERYRANEKSRISADATKRSPPVDPDYGIPWIPYHPKPPKTPASPEHLERLIAQFKAEGLLREDEDSSDDDGATAAAAATKRSPPANPDYGIPWTPYHPNPASFLHFISPEEYAQLIAELKAAGRIGEAETEGGDMPITNKRLRREKLQRRRRAPQQQQRDDAEVDDAAVTGGNVLMEPPPFMPFKELPQVPGLFEEEGGEQRRRSADAQPPPAYPRVTIPLDEAGTLAMFPDNTPLQQKEPAPMVAGGGGGYATRPDNAAREAYAMQSAATAAVVMAAVVTAFTVIFFAYTLCQRRRRRRADAANAAAYAAGTDGPPAYPATDPTAWYAGAASARRSPRLLQRPRRAATTAQRQARAGAEASRASWLRRLLSPRRADDAPRQRQLPPTWAVDYPPPPPPPRGQGNSAYPAGRTGEV